MKIIDEEKRKDIFSLISEYLKDELVLLHPLRLKVEDNIAGQVCKATIQIKENDVKKTLTSTGAGAVESIFDALMGHYSETYCSLKTIRFAEFDVRTNFKSKSRGSSGADARCEVRISLMNASRNPMLFVGRSRSLSGAIAQSVVDAYQYYINAEKCFLKVRGLLDEARSRNRGDIMAKLTYDLTELVSVTNYDTLGF